MKLADLRPIAVVAFAPFVVGCTDPSLPADGSIPTWLQELVSANGGPPPEIQKVTYDGQPAFNLNATDRFDAGDEHALYTSGGKLICRYGGYGGEVTSGSCDPGKIVYVSTLYTPRKH